MSKTPCISSQHKSRHETESVYGSDWVRERRQMRAVQAHGVAIGGKDGQTDRRKNVDPN